MSIPMMSFNRTSIGHNHIRVDKICEDSSDSYNAENMAIAVVADGHGSDNYPRTDRGSRFAVQAAMNCVKEFIVRVSPDDLIHEKTQPAIFAQLSKSILSSWHTNVENDFSNNPFTGSELAAVAEKYKKYYLSGERVAKAYGSTLIVIGATKEFWFGLHIGDGKCVAVDVEGNFSQPIPWDDNCQSNITTSICDSDASEEFRYFVSAKIPMAVFIGTDGIDDSYSSDDELGSLYRSVLSIFGEYSFEVGCKEVEEYLPTLSKRGSGDDVSVAGILDPQEVITSLQLLKAQTEYSAALALKTNAKQTLVSTKERIERATITVKKGSRLISEAKASQADATAKLEKAKGNYDASQCNYDEAVAAFELAVQNLTKVKSTYRNKNESIKTNDLSDAPQDAHCDVPTEYATAETELDTKKVQNTESI
jgi:serine/threonine protein phosphatase PrpC